MNKPACLICQGIVSVTLRTRKKSGKPFLMLLCEVDPRHYRAFINDEAFVSSVAVGRHELKS